MKTLTLLLFSFLSCFTNSTAQVHLEQKITEQYRTENTFASNQLSDTLSASEAELRLYEEVTFTGKVISTFYADFEKGQPTFLNIDKLFPDNPVVLVIFKDDLAKFPLMSDFRGKTIVASGKVKLYKYEFGWKSSVVLTKAEQIAIVD